MLTVSEQHYARSKTTAVGTMHIVLVRIVDAIIHIRFNRDTNEVVDGWDAFLQKFPDEVQESWGQGRRTTINCLAFAMQLFNTNTVHTIRILTTKYGAPVEIYRDLLDGFFQWVCVWNYSSDVGLVHIGQMANGIRPSIGLAAEPNIIRQEANPSRNCLVSHAIG